MTHEFAQQQDTGDETEHVDDLLDRLGCAVTQPTFTTNPPPIMTPREGVLRSASELTGGNRDGDYGPPTINLALAGKLKQVFRDGCVRRLSPGEMEAIDQVLTKIGRIGTGLKVKRDNYVDGAAYFGIAYECAMAGA